MKIGQACEQAAKAATGLVHSLEPHSPVIDAWKVDDDMFTEIVTCESDDELMQLREEARINYVLSFLTENALAIGPDEDERVNRITRNLKLL